MLLILAPRLLVQTFNMLMTFNYSLRAMTCNLLGLRKDVQAAEYVKLRPITRSLSFPVPIDH